MGNVRHFGSKHWAKVTEGDVKVLISADGVRNKGAGDNIWA